MRGVKVDLAEAMKLLEPRRKRRVTAVPRPPFPIQIESETGIPASRALWQVYTGIFNGDCVVVDEPHEMDFIFNMGFFGKGSLSRGGPEFGMVKKGLPPYLRNRQWLRRKEWAEEQEKIERAANTEGITNDQTVVGDGETDKYVTESVNNEKESIAREKSDSAIVTAGPSGNQGTENFGKRESSQNNVVTCEASDLNSAKNNSDTKLASSFAKASLKEMDVVVLSDDDAPKRRSNSSNPRDEIEVIDNSSNDAVSKPDAHTGHSKSESQNRVKDSVIAICEVEKDIVDVSSSPVHVPQARKQNVGVGEDIIEIVDTVMDVDVDVATIASNSEHNVKEVECAFSGSRRHKDGSTDVVMVQDIDSRSGTDVVTVEDADSSYEKGMVAMQKRVKEDGSESEESDVEERCKRIVTSSLGCKVLVLPDSDSEDEGHRSYMKNIHARLEWEEFPVRETLHLSLEEAFFLSYGLGCLQVLDPFGNVLSLVDLWKMFCEAQTDFVSKYVAYHYLRAKGWVVRSGLKYGGDFLLYKQGPVFYHASYVVIVEVLQAEDWSRHSTLNSRSFSWANMTTLNRVVTAAGKELLMCQVIWPTGISNKGPDSPASLPQFTVNEVLMRRWVASEEREKDENLEWDA